MGRSNLFGSKPIKPTEAKHYPSMTSAQRRECRLSYETSQRNYCQHCGVRLYLDPPQYKRRIDWRAFPGGKAGFLRYPVHLHHDHNTGMTIGAVHAYCNAVLWQFHGE